MDHIVNSYKSGKSMSEISKLYKISRQSISKILKINNIEIINKRRRIYNPNHSFFSNIDSESKAYMLGFIFADGSIYQNRIRIELSSKDKHILEMFSNEIYKLNLVKHFNKNNKSYCLLDIHSEQIKEDLKKYSCISNKSKILTFPNINQNLYNHFIRGLIDGDGFVSVKSKTIGLLSTNNINTKIKEIFESLNIKSFISKAYKQDKNILNEIRVKKQSSLLILIDFLYKNSNIYLQRKYDSAMEIKQAYTSCNQ